MLSELLISPNFGVHIRTSYSAPSVEILSISIEKGFANSTVLDYGGAGEAGGSVNDTDYGEY